MPTPREKGGNKSARETATIRATDAQANAILARTDWEKYWEEVSDRVTREVEAYEAARARSLEEVAHQVFL